MTEISPIPLNASTVAALTEEYVGKLASTLRPDYLAALEAALATEQSERGREVIEQLLVNARIAASEGLPLCQDTGSVWVCLEVSGSVSVPADIFSGVDAAVARVSEAAGLRMSMVRDALVDRSNTKDNTPAFCEVLVRRLASFGEKPVSDSSSGDSSTSKASYGDSSASKASFGDSSASKAPYGDKPVSDSSYGDKPTATLHIMLKGGGSDNASALAMLPPGAGTQGVLDFVVDAVAAKGANACPPLVLGVGVGGSFDKVAGLAKHALLREVGSVHPIAEIAALEELLLARINALDIGPGGLGGSTTALAVHINSAPCHIAALPVAVNIGCTALRSVSVPLL